MGVSVGEEAALEAEKSMGKSMKQNWAWISLQSTGRRPVQLELSAERVRPQPTLEAAAITPGL